MVLCDTGVPRGPSVRYGPWRSRAVLCSDTVMLSWGLGLQVGAGHPLAEALAPGSPRTCLAVGAKPVAWAPAGTQPWPCSSCWAERGSQGLLALPQALSGLSEPSGVL